MYTVYYSYCTGTQVQSGESGGTAVLHSAAVGSSELPVEPYSCTGTCIGILIDSDSLNRVNVELEEERADSANDDDVTNPV